MINRVLIRIIVVQILYSYLLQEKHFMTESQPGAPTKENRFAYRLYLDLLALMILISKNFDDKKGLNRFSESRFLYNIRNDEMVKSTLQKYAAEEFDFNTLLYSLIDKIKETGFYKIYLKEKIGDAKADLTFWKEVFKFLINDSSLNDILSKRLNYSVRGVEKTKMMMEETFINSLSSQSYMSEAMKTLDKSMQMARELYFRLLLLPVELTQLREKDIDANRHKYLVKDEDLNPNMKFVENQFISSLCQNDEFNNYISKNKISWLPDDEPLLRSLLKAIMESDVYKEYMEFPVSDNHLDCEFWRDIYKQVIFRNQDFLEELEDKSVFWNDDLEIIGTFLLKTIKRFDELNPKEAILPMYKDEEDAKFGAELFSYVLKNKEEYRKYIDTSLNRATWDMERLAFMDVIIIETAIAELLNFPKIPTTVTINEYIEIAKSYSTVKSGKFVHGILGAIIAQLRKEGKLIKE